MGQAMARASTKSKPDRTQRAAAWRILIAHGVNLDLLGTREPEIYGKTRLGEIDRELARAASRLLADVGAPRAELTFFQTNDEAAFLNELAGGWDGIVINPGAWGHTSIALADRLAGLGMPYVEVHMSNVWGREEFRHHSWISAKAAGVVVGFGADSYLVGLAGLLRLLSRS